MVNIFHTNDNSNDIALLCSLDQLYKIIKNLQLMILSFAFTASCLVTVDNLKAQKAIKEIFWNLD